MILRMISLRGLKKTEVISISGPDHGIVSRQWRCPTYHRVAFAEAIVDHPRSLIAADLSVCEIRAPDIMSPTRPRFIHVLRASNS